MIIGTSRLVPAVLHWSSGKDAAFALHKVRKEGRFHIRALLTTVSEEHARVAVHGVRRALLVAQAKALALPVIEVPLPVVCSNSEYEARMARVFAQLEAEGVVDHLFGDLHLADVRAYREAQLAAHGLQAHFPLWSGDSRALASEMIAAGIKARIVAIDVARMPRELLGGAYDETLLASLPPEVDPCGERGEFHSLVTDAPAFSQPLNVEPGTVVERDGFLYQDFRMIRQP